jgi:beta-1,4-mannosyl-glycoprotein beta-1,4-N-acetylglucosaminyltransferase
VENVLLSDVRDVIFQGDPFKFFSGRGLEFALEVKRIGECEINSSWINTRYGADEFNQIKDQWIINAGVVAGPRHGIIRLCDLVMEDAAQAPSPLYPDFVDQAAINVLYRRGMFPNATLHRTGDAAISTVGHATHFSMDKQGHVLSDDLQRVAMVHQYDRLKILVSQFDKNIRPKKSKIVDCFTFFNELDLLEGRLEYLYDTVDYFVIVEADVTHSGQPKPFNYTDNVARFKKYQNKILYFPVCIPVDEFEWNNAPEKLANRTSTFWQIENYQRNCISQGLELFDDTDIVMISDLDEIPHKQNLALFTQYLENTPIFGLEQRMKVCNLDEQPGLWIGPVMTYVKRVKEQSPQWIRENRFQSAKVAGGGWHLTWWGGAEKIQTKIKNFAHQELNTPEFTDISRIQERIIQNKHPINELVVNYDCPPEGALPEDFVKIFSKYIK